jgi:hypothetical protein
MRNLESGELPEVRISITPATILNLGIMMFFVAVSVVLTTQVIKKIAKTG